MTRFLHIVTRTLSILLLLGVLQSCGRPRRLSKASLADAVWTFRQTHPDGLYYFDSVRRAVRGEHITLG